jgi:hypothetical protein
MPRKKVADLKWRIVPSDEVKSVPRVRRKDQEILDLQTKFVNPDTEQHITVGEAVEAGPFDSVEEGRNWFRYYMPDAYKQMNWGKLKDKSNKTRSPIAIEPHTKEDGKVYIWVIRETE